MTGVGLGLRWSFFEELERELDHASERIAFFEVSPENYMRRGGHVRGVLDRVRARFPVFSHGLTLSIGGLDPLGDAYLGELRAFLDEVGAPFHSDHLCFGGHGGRVVHDLLPLPFIEEAVTNTVARANEVRDRIDRPLALENISYYAHPGAADMSEASFIRAVLEGADLGLLLDVNNIVVNAANFGFDARAFLDSLPLERVVQLHVAGHEFRPEHGRIIDTHGAPTGDAALDLLTYAVAQLGPVPVLLERDNNIPSLPVLFEELDRVRSAYERGLAAFERPRVVAAPVEGAA